eukprot:GHVT01051089.1.p1 GENE.GHVT01051089.1~~GHVT01051089.1.p1  ORF type:complete len:120 (+),score=4.86 GHVT01051089.1:720-1079(+)
MILNRHIHPHFKEQFATSFDVNSNDTWQLFPQYFSRLLDTMESLRGQEPNVGVDGKDLEKRLVRLGTRKNPRLARGILLLFRSICAITFPFIEASSRALWPTSLPTATTTSIATFYRID